MKREKQVCLIDQAAKLKDLGIHQRLANYFWDLADGELYHSSDGSAADVGCVGAFTVAELGVMLPNGFDTLQITRSAKDNGWRGFDDDNTDYPYDHVFSTEAECRAAMLISLLEKKVTTPEECNKRLQD